MFTIVMSYKHPLSPVSSCYGWVSTGYTGIFSKINYNQKLYDCPLRFGRARDLSLPSGSSRRPGMEKPVQKRAVNGGRSSSVRSGNEKGGRGKRWQKSSPIWLVGNLFVKAPSQYLTCFEKARLLAFLISGLLAFEIAHSGILKFWCVLSAC